MTTTSKQLLTWGLCGIQRYAVSAMVSHKMLVEGKGGGQFFIQVLETKMLLSLQSFELLPGMFHQFPQLQLEAVLMGTVLKNL